MNDDFIKLLYDKFGEIHHCKKVGHSSYKFDYHGLIRSIYVQVGMDKANDNSLLYHEAMYECSPDLYEKSNPYYLFVGGKDLY